MGPVGVLALQGGFAAHLRAFRALGCVTREVRDVEALEGLAALALPGGESTAQRRLIAWSGLGEALDAFVASGRPVLATCAGVIVAAERGWLDVTVARNAWGRQAHSFEARAEVGETVEALEGLPMCFIRAPRIVRYGSAVRVLASHQGEPVLVRQGALLAACFHPELTDDLRLHAWVVHEAAASP